MVIAIEHRNRGHNVVRQMNVLVDREKGVVEDERRDWKRHWLFVCAFSLIRLIEVPGYPSN